MKQFDGKVLFLNRADINTDEIIPARYLTEITKEALKPYLLEDLKLPGFDPETGIEGRQVVITRANFGCGSSREHAPWAFEVNGIHLIIAESFARIFRQNMFNCGMLALELPGETIDRIFTEFDNQETFVRTDLKTNRISLRAGEKHLDIPFTLGEFDRALIQAGGWVEYADAHY
ncbi:MAG: 3-isopropylmalate dehydratase small subunit [Thermodesulfobacteriota bacterium]